VELDRGGGFVARASPGGAVVNLVYGIYIALACALAVAAALAIWNVYLVGRGTRVSLKVGSLRAAFVTAGAVLLLAAVYAPFVVYPLVTE
jgi:predicted permease